MYNSPSKYAIIENSATIDIVTPGDYKPLRLKTRRLACILKADYLEKDLAEAMPNARMFAAGANSVYCLEAGRASIDGLIDSLEKGAITSRKAIQEILREISKMHAEAVEFATGGEKFEITENAKNG